MGNQFEWFCCERDILGNPTLTEDVKELSQLLTIDAALVHFAITLQAITLQAITLQAK